MTTDFHNVTEDFLKHYKLNKLTKTNKLFDTFALFLWLKNVAFRNFFVFHTCTLELLSTFSTMLVLDNKSFGDCYTTTTKSRQTLFQIHPGLIMIEIVPFELSSQIKKKKK